MGGGTQSEENVTDEEPTVPAGVIDGIEDIDVGHPADGDDLDDALDL